MPIPVSCHTSHLVYLSNPTRTTFITIRGIERKASLGERVLLASLSPGLLNVIFCALLFFFRRVIRRPTGILQCSWEEEGGGGCFRAFRLALVCFV